MAEFGDTVPGLKEAIDNLTDELGQKADATITAADIPYDNTVSGLAATNVQAAIDELKGLV